MQKSRYRRVFVAESDIPNAGLGLYASRTIKAGAPICPYEGEILHADGFDVRYAETPPRYSVPMPGQPNITIDAYHCTWALGRYANGADKPGARLVANAELQANDTGTGVDLIASRRIRACEEILINYGPDYWRGEDQSGPTPKESVAAEELLSDGDESLGSMDTTDESEIDGDGEDDL